MKKILVVLLLAIANFAVAQGNPAPYLVATLVGGELSYAPASTTLVPGGNPPPLLCETLNASGQLAYCSFSSGAVTWPASGDIVVSNSSNSPTGIAPVNGECVVGSGGAWIAGACSGTAATAFSALTGSTNNSGQVMIVGSTSSLGVSGTGSITATNVSTCATAGLATTTSGGVLGCEAVPTWNQNTTGYAAGLAGGAVGSAPYQSAANTTLFIASPTTTGHTFVYAWQPTGSAIDPTAFDITTYLTSGTVTTVSVATANGVSGSVANPTTTPAITLTLGAITPSTVNGLTFTANSTGFGIAGGTTSKTLTIDNSLTFAGTDSTTMTFPATSTTVAGLGIAQTFSAVQTISAANGLVLSAMTGTACLEEVSGVVTSTGSACGTGGSLSFPATVSGTTSSGGIPYFSNTTTLTSSGLLATNALVVGGGVGGAPATGNADFTYATHTLTGSSSGLVVLAATNALTLSAMTGTSCLEEVSGVVTSTGSTCGTGGSPALSAVTGSAAQATGTETAAGHQYTFAGVETGNLTYPFSFTDANSTNNDTSGAVVIGTTGTSTGVVPLALNEATAAGNFIAAYSGGTVSNGVLSGGTLEFSVSATGAIVALGSLSVGSSAPTACGSAAGCWAATEASTAGTPTTGVDYIRASSSTHQYLISLNDSSEFVSLMNFAGDGATLTESGTTLSCTTATTSQLGCVKPDGTIITDTTGLITVAKASASAFGVMEAGSGLGAASGVISTNAQYRTWACEPGVGDGLNAVPAGTYLQTECLNTSGVTWTISGLQCFTDNSGSSTLNATDGSNNALLTGAITCSSSFAAGTQGSTTTIANNGYVKFTFVADGTSKQSTFVIYGTY